MSELHAVHAAFLAAGTYFFTKSIPWTVAVGGSAMTYILAFGHALPGAHTAVQAPQIVLHGFQKRDDYIPRRRV